VMTDTGSQLLWTLLLSSSTLSAPACRAITYLRHRLTPPSLSVYDLCLHGHAPTIKRAKRRQGFVSTPFLD
jgi:hypothetical protein